MSFIDKIREGIAIITGYIAIAIQILTTFNEVMPQVVEFIIDKVDEFFSKIEKGDVTKEEAIIAVTNDTLAEFHGSGPVISRQDVVTIAEQYIKVAKAKRGEFDYKMEEIAIHKGYVKPTELDKVRKAWPGFQPLD